MCSTRVGWISLALTILLSACSSAPTLVGNWNLHAPNQTTIIKVTIKDFGNGDYYLAGNTPMDGIYHKQGDQFLCVKPNDPRLTQFIWRIQDSNTLVLISQPSVWVSQERYLGAELQRPNK